MESSDRPHSVGRVLLQSRLDLCGRKQPACGPTFSTTEAALTEPQASAVGRVVLVNERAQYTGGGNARAGGFDTLGGRRARARRGFVFGRKGAVLTVGDDGEGAVPISCTLRRALRGRARAVAERPSLDAVPK